MDVVIDRGDQINAVREVSRISCVRTIVKLPSSMMVLNSWFLSSVRYSSTSNDSTFSVDEYVKCSVVATSSNRNTLTHNFHTRTSPSLTVI